MPSEVWQYFEEFDGGARCRMCGIVRNRKDKSTSTFWQHLKKVHHIIQPKSIVKEIKEDSETSRVGMPAAIKDNCLDMNFFVSFRYYF